MGETGSDIWGKWGCVGEFKKTCSGSVVLSEPSSVSSPPRPPRPEVSPALIISLTWFGGGLRGRG